MRFLHRLIVLSSLFFLLACSNPFNPDISKNNDITRDYVYTPNTPDNVLRNLMLAYNQKDLELYKNCLDESFRFQVLSNQAPEIGFDWWGFEQEIEYHKNLFNNGSSDGKFNSPTNIHLNLEIPPSTMWYMDNQVGHEDWVIISCPFYLQLSFSNYPDIVASGFARFHLKETKGRWYIAIWVDESNQ
jgi:hypothetical protein